jgi:hypothetical protein
MNNFETIRKFLIDNYRAFDHDDSVRVMFGNKTVHYSWFTGPGTIQVTISNNLEMKIDAVSIKEMNLNDIIDFQTDLRNAVGLMNFVKTVNSKE